MKRGIKLPSAFLASAQAMQEGRADGIFTDETGENIDEIKGVYRDIRKMEEPVPVHRAQAFCYAYIYALQNGLSGMGLRMAYCHIPTEKGRIPEHPA